MSDNEKLGGFRDKIVVAVSTLVFIGFIIYAEAIMKLHFSTNLKL